MNDAEARLAIVRAIIEGTPAHQFDVREEWGQIRKAVRQEDGEGAGRRPRSAADQRRGLLAREVLAMLEFYAKNELACVTLTPSQLRRLVELAMVTLDDLGEARPW